MIDIDKKSALGFAFAFGVCLLAFQFFVPRYSSDDDKNNDKPNIVWLVFTVLFSAGFSISTIIFIFSFLPKISN